MIRKRSRGEEPALDAPTQETVPASPTEIAELSHVVSAAWHGLKQGRNFLAAQYTHRIDGDSVAIQARGENSLNYLEWRLSLGDDIRNPWEIHVVTVTQDVEAGGAAEFSQTTATYPLRVDGEVTFKTVTCQKGPDQTLQPISRPTAESYGPITESQVAGLEQSLRDLGAMGSPAVVE